MLSSPGLYIHFPWCVKKCPYCDFNSHPIKGVAPQKEYFAAVAQDLTHQQMTYGSKKYRSVFFGGGTPSLASPHYIEDVLSATNLDESVEVTLELNPGALEFSNLSELRSAGVNRISMGAQSFNDKHLNSLGRIHESREIFSAFESIRDTGFTNINIDLMWGLPHQTVSQAIKDLEQAVALEPEHISWYQLTIEPKTEFYKNRPKLPRDPTLTQIEEEGLRLLSEHRYLRYEISAFAQESFECRHNLNYWNFGDYLGVGAGAHGKLTFLNRVIRTQKPSQPRIYQNQPSETLILSITQKDLILEFMMNALRLVDGADWSSFERNTGLLISDVESIWSQLTDLGLVNPNKCQTTPFGYRNLDSVLEHFCF